jgi:hypothetical protein
MTIKIALCLLVAAPLAVPAAASPDRDLGAAVRSLETVAQLSPSDGGAQIELAAAYQRAGRTADANNAFRRVLVLDNAMLETPTGDSVWSHQVARRALGHDVALTSR